MKYMHIAYLICVAGIISACQRLPSGSNSEADKDTYHLIMRSSMGCGHCIQAYRDLQTIDTGIIDIDVHVYFTPEETIQEYIKAYPTFNWINASSDKVQPKLFPIFWMFNSENQKVWYESGWHSAMLQEIKHIVQES